MDKNSAFSIERLSNADLRLLAELFLARRDDLQFLDVLNSELKKRSGSEARKLQWKVAAARQALTRVAEAPAIGQPVMRAATQSHFTWLSKFLSQRGLQTPDGRTLHRYRVSDTEFQGLKTILKSLVDQRRLEEASDTVAALFVAYCADWFRRESITTFLRWDDPLRALPADLTFPSRHDLTRRGLAYWGRTLRRSPAATEYLLTLALEGGIPVRILTDGARGWLKDYLRATMRRAAAWGGSEDAATEAAQEERWRVRDSYQHNDFVALCSELAWHLLRLRRLVETSEDGTIRNSALLDLKRPGWRDELPVYVPREDNAVAAELLTGLLDVKLTGLVTEGVETRRFLINQGDKWLPAVQLVADGEIPQSKLPHLLTQGRIHAVPSGELANRISGEIALLEPPAEKHQRFRVRPLIRLSTLITNFPFNTPVTVTMHAPGCSPATWIWPQGDALRSDVLVFAADEGSAPGTLLRYMRSGSLRSSKRTLYVLVPETWHVEGETENAIVFSTLMPSQMRKLVVVSGTTYFSASTDQGERYRIEPNATEQSSELVLPIAHAAGFSLTDDRYELVCTPARPAIHEEGQKAREPRTNELWIRRPGGLWSPLTGLIEGSGLLELSWRDPAAGIQIEKRMLAMIPDGAEVRGHLNDATSGTVHLNRMPEWRATVRDPECQWRGGESSSVTFTFDGKPNFRLGLTLHPPKGPCFDIVLPLAGRHPVIVLADGALPGERIDVGALRGAVAMSPQPETLQLGPRGRKSGGLAVRIDGELPLGILRAAVNEMLATLPNQDDVVEIAFLGDSRPPLRICRYRHEQLHIDDGQLKALPASIRPGIIPVARMVSNPKLEHALRIDGLGIWHLPEDCSGTCLVYLRDGPDVISRPNPATRPGGSGIARGQLMSTLAIPDFGDRQTAIKAALSCIAGTEGSADDLTWLVEATVNLNGLPPTSLDALKYLPAQPAALVRVLLFAKDASARAAVWSLQNELPFLWLELPLPDWKNAIENDFNAFIRLLTPIFGEQKAIAEASHRLLQLRDELLGLEPALAEVLRLSSVPSEKAATPPALQQLVNSYIINCLQQEGFYQSDLAEQMGRAGLALPHEITSKSHQDFPGLFAPVLLAASARERLNLSVDQALLVRRTLREDPAYVSAAYWHLLKFFEPNRK